MQKWISFGHLLTILADKLGLTLSVFVRGILISNLFGHTYLYERKALIAMQVEFEN